MGVGNYNNETRQHDYDEYIMEGEWYLSEDGTLYILPMYGDEILGPDDENKRTLTRHYIDNDLDVEYLRDKHGLSNVPTILKRFSPQDGYYTA